MPNLFIDDTADRVRTWYGLNTGNIATAELCAELARICGVDPLIVARDIRHDHEFPDWFKDLCEKYDVKINGDFKGWRLRQRK